MEPLNSTICPQSAEAMKPRHVSIGTGQANACSETHRLSTSACAPERPAEMIDRGGRDRTVGLGQLAVREPAVHLAKHGVQADDPVRVAVLNDQE